MLQSLLRSLANDSNLRGRNDAGGSVHHHLWGRAFVLARPLMHVERHFSTGLHVPAPASVVGASGGDGAGWRQASMSASSLMRRLRLSAVCVAACSRRISSWFPDWLARRCCLAALAACLLARRIALGGVACCCGNALRGGTCWSAGEEGVHCCCGLRCCCREFARPLAPRSTRPSC